MGSIGNQNISQVKLIITIHASKVVEKHILNTHEINKESISESKKEFDEHLAH